MKALGLQTTSAAAQTPDLREEAYRSAGPVNGSTTSGGLPLGDSASIESVPPKVAQAIAAMGGQVRSTFIFLQLLVIVVMGASAILNPHMLQLERSAWLPITGLVVIFGLLLCLPLRLLASDWFPGLLVLLDTMITATLFYYSDIAGVEAYAAYFFIIMIALLTRTKKHVVLYSVFVTSMYGLAFYQDSARVLLTFDSHLWQLPLTLAMAVACGRAMESLKVLATCDPVTGLPSRQQFMYLVNRAMKKARKSRETLGVLFLEIVGIEENVTGQNAIAGDRIIKSIVNRLIPLVQRGDIVARHGRACLSILTRNYITPAEVASLAHDCVDTIRVPYIASGKTVRLTAHIGAELVPDARRGAAGTMIQNAKMALARAKTRGTNCYEFYSEDMESRSYDPLFLEMSLRKALARRELSVSYQPKVNLLTGQLTGTEALMRWHHPDLGSLSPAVFIPLAEGSGLIEPLGEWILRAACLQGIGWKERGLLPVVIGVNVSPRQLRNPQLIPMVSRILTETNLNPQCLELEITESVLIGEADGALEALNKLKSLGVYLSVDDFGTGYSGLSYLAKLPVDALKIDQRFVRDIGKGYQTKAILKGVVSMALSLGLRVTAEGVENLDQALFLRDLGCHEAQGFLYSKPLSSEEMEGYLHNEKQRQVMEVTKTTLIEALANRYDTRIHKST